MCLERHHECSRNQTRKQREKENKMKKKEKMCAFSDTMNAPAIIAHRNISIGSCTTERERGEGGGGGEREREREKETQSIIT
jgi:hypothetical protein